MTVARANLGAAALMLAGFAAGCVSEPDFAGRACTTESPCPEPFECGADRTCHRPCVGDEECLGDRRCMSGLCLPLPEQQPCVNEDDCAAGSLCRAGICEPESAQECKAPADCTTPGPCQIADGVSCDAGRCLYGSVACDAPPGAECVGDVFRTYAGGACEAASGTCTYSVTDTPCPSCEQTCLEPCEGVTCPDLEGGCRVLGRCEPAGPGVPAACAYEDAQDGLPCERSDGGAGSCQAGTCLACAGPEDCDDNNPCTLDACDGSGACTHSPISGSCDDANACTSGDACMNGLCRGTAAVTCDTAPGECFSAAGTCDPGTGQCSYPPKSEREACSSDNQACTRDVCDGSGLCTHPPEAAGVVCDDGALCTHTDRCDGNGGCAGTAIVCTDSSGVCAARRACDGTPQCAVTYPGNSVSCDDASLCTHTDRCNGVGGCQGTSYTCNDGDICTQDTCDGVGTCSFTTPVPSGLAPTAGITVSRQDVTLVWSPCSSADQYEVVIQYRGADNTWRAYFTYTETVNNKTFWPCSNTAPGIPCNSDFRFRVRARSGGTYGPFAPWATFHWANCRTC